MGVFELEDEEDGLSGSTENNGSVGIINGQGKIMVFKPSKKEKSKRYKYNDAINPKIKKIILQMILTMILIQKMKEKIIMKVIKEFKIIQMKMVIQVMKVINVYNDYKKSFINEELYSAVKRYKDLEP